MSKRKVGRPHKPKAERQSEEIRFKVKTADMKLIRAAAKRQGMEVSEWCRGVLLTATRPSS